MDAGVSESAKYGNANHGVANNGIAKRESAEDNWNEYEASQLEMVQEAVNFIRSRLPKGYPPVEVGVVCGSGCGGIAEALVDGHAIQFEDIPHFIKVTVTGHKGLMHVGTLRGKKAVLLQGRFHAYEGHDCGQAAFPIRVMKLLGATKVILTMATGGLNQDYRLGDLVIVKDHISFPVLAGESPLRGPNDNRMGPRFVAQNNAYDRDLRKLAKNVAEKLGMDFVREGIYIQTMGPNFETPIECRFLRMIGGDVVGMSNSHEVLVARHMDVKILSISLICNMCIMDVDDEAVTDHGKILETSGARGNDLRQFVSEIVAQLD